MGTQVRCRARASGEALALFSCKVKVYRAIIDVQSAKLNNDNVRVRDYQVAMGRAEVSIMERRLEEHRQRVKLAISILSFRPFLVIAASGYAQKRDRG